jgi:hypothetical protein
MLDQYEPFNWPPAARAPEPDHSEGEVDAVIAEFLARRAYWRSYWAGHPHQVPRW